MMTCVKIINNIITSVFYKEYFSNLNSNGKKIVTYKGSIRETKTDNPILVSSLMNIFKLSQI